MVKVEFGMVRDKFWFYYKEEGSEPETVQVTAVRGKTVDLSNGESIPAASFYEVCEPAFEEEPMVSEGEHESNMMMAELEDLGIDTGTGKGPQPGGDLINEVMAGVQFDSNGVPVMGPAQPQQRPRLDQQKPLQPNIQPQRVQQTVESPLIALTERGKTKLTKLNFAIEFPTVDKTLFNALMDTYPEEEIDLLLEHFISKIGIDNIKDIIKQRVLQHYKPTIKKDATS